MRFHVPHALESSRGSTALAIASTAALAVPTTTLGAQGDDDVVISVIEQTTPAVLTIAQSCGRAVSGRLRAMSEERYPIRIGQRSAPFLRIFVGVTADRAWAMVADGQVAARFGWWQFRVPIGNIAYWRIEGPWRWITAIGVRRSLRHGDVSFAGSPRGGVRLDFRTPVRWTLFWVPAFYIGVDDLDGFAAELTALGIPGEDVRRS